MLDRSHRKISVVIPNYNNALYLPQCLESVLNQTFLDIEIVVIDDASTDHSLEIIGRFASSDNRIKVIANDERLGISRNRHKGIMEATSYWLTTLDSDDYYCDQRKIEAEMALVHRFEAEKGEEVCAFSNIIVVDEKGEFVMKQWPDEKVEEGDIFKGVFSRTSMIPRDFTFNMQQYLNAGGYDPQFNLYEDWDLKIRIARNTRFFFTGLDGIAYRRKGQGLSYAPVSEHVATIRRIYRKNEALLSPDEKDHIFKGLSGYLQ